MSNSAQSGQGSEGGNNGQGEQGSNGQGNGQSWTPPTQEQWQAQQDKVRTLENDNFNYRQSRREGGSSQTPAQGANGQGTQGQNQGEGKSARETELESLLVSRDFRHSLENEALKRGVKNPEVLSKLVNMSEYGTPEGGIKDVEATFKELQLIYPQFFPQVQGSANGSESGNGSGNSGQSFSDQIRNELRPR